MARKKGAAKAAPRKRNPKTAPEPEPTTPVRVLCVGEDCWAGGAGFLALGDEAMVSPDRARELKQQKKVEFLKGQG